MARSLLFALLAVGTTLTANAQSGTVRGFVTEARSEEPMQGANVILRAPDGAVRGAVTDGDGYFRLGGVPPGTWRLSVTFIGFRPFEEPVVVTAGETLTMRIALDEAEGVLEEVVIVAEAESGIAAVAAGLETIRPMDVARVPVPGAAGDLAAYVQSVPGVVLPGDRGGRFHIRGGSDDQNLVLLEGIPVYGPFHMLSMYSAFPDDVIDRVDFYTAGFGAAYGERLSSMLDVRTRNGNKQALGGSVALAPFLSGLVVEGPIVPGRVSVMASGRRSLVADVTPTLLGQKMPYRFGDALAKVHALLGSGHAVSLFGLVTDDEGQIAGSQFTFQGDPVSTPATDSLDLRWDNRVIGGTYRIDPGSWPLGVAITAGHSRYTSSFGPLGAEERATSLESLDLRLDATLYLAAADLEFGALRRETDLWYRLAEAFRDIPAVSEETLVEWSGYLQGTFEPAGSGLDVEPGIRLYTAEGFGPVRLEPRIRATWNLPLPVHGHRLMAAWGRVHQSVVALSDERDVGNPFAVWTVTPDGADVPRSTHAVVGWNGPVVRGARVAVEFFRKGYEHLQVPVFSALPTFTTALQPADGTARGVDVRFSVEDQPFWFDSRLGGWVSYAYTRVRYETDAGVAFPPPHDRRHSIQGVLEAAKGEVSFTLQAQVSSGLPFTPSSGFDVWYPFTPDVDVGSDPGQARVLYGAPNSARQPMYARFDAWIERRIDRGRTVATLRAGAMNVLNRSNLFYFDLFTFRRVDQLPFIPSVGIKLEVR